MKTTNFCIVLAMAFLFFSCGEKREVPEPETANPPTTLVSPAQVRGFMVSDAKDFDRNALNAAAEWGANIIRIPIHPDKFAQINQRGIWDALPAYLDILAERIQWAREKNMKVIIDLHGVPVENPGDISQPAFWNNPEVKPGFIRIWKEIATKFKGSSYDDVIWGYDLYNEPVEKVPNTAHIPFKWREMVPEIISAIREMDSDVWIIYEPGPWGEVLGYKDLTPLEDKRVIYSIHYYKPQDSFTHQGVYFPSDVTTREQAQQYIGKTYPGVHENTTWNKEKMEESMAPVVAFQKKHNVPILVGEFSVVRWAPVESSKQWLTDVIDIFEKNNWSWCYHAFREWHGWDLEYKEGTGEFWFRGDPYPERSQTETERAKIIKAALQKNKFLCLKL